MAMPVRFQVTVGLILAAQPEGESEAKSSDGKSLTTRVTMVKIRCAFLEVHMEE